MFEGVKKQWAAYGERKPSERRVSRASYAGCLGVVVILVLCIAWVLVRLVWALIPLVDHDVIAPVVRWLTTW